MWIYSFAFVHYFAAYSPALLILFHSCYFYLQFCLFTICADSLILSVYCSLAYLFIVNIAVCKNQFHFRLQGGSIFSPLIKLQPAIVDLRTRVVNKSTHPVRYLSNGRSLSCLPFSLAVPHSWNRKIIAVQKFLLAPGDSENLCNTVMKSLQFERLQKFCKWAALADIAAHLLLSVYLTELAMAENIFVPFVISVLMLALLSALYYVGIDKDNDGLMIPMIVAKVSL